jgi:hypothetical protein
MSYSDDFLKFDSIINPLGKKIYHFTDFNVNYAAKDSFTKIETLYGAFEILILLSSKEYRNVKVDLSQTEFVCIDIDDIIAYNYIKNRFNEEGIVFIEVSSYREGHAHFYLKRKQTTKTKKSIMGLSASVHDYYFPNRPNPASMVLPRPENNRKFISIPENVSFIPDYIFD